MNFLPHVSVTSKKYLQSFARNRDRAWYQQNDF